MGSFKQDIKDTYLGLSESIQEKWGDFTQFLQEAWPLLLLLLAILMGVWMYADPPPPNHVLLATGSAGGSYEVLGKKYAEYFAKKGVTLELVPTMGAQENIERLADRMGYQLRYELGNFTPAPAGNRSRLIAANALAARLRDASGVTLLATTGAKLKQILAAAREVAEVRSA